MRLIDADELVNVLKDPPVHASLGGMTMADVLSLVDEAPTIDAEPIRHGKWVIESIPSIGWERVSCSVCGENVTSIAPIVGGHCTFTYCQNCGAKMDLQ